MSNRRSALYNTAMIPLFVGLSAANILLLLIVFAMGLIVMDGGGEPGVMYPYHLALGFAAGLMVLAAHLGTFMYFMATTRWLQAACDKANLDQARFAAPALRRKSLALRIALAAIGMTMLTMFAGAGADRTLRPLWPAEVHLLLATATIAVNVLCAIMAFPLIRAQGRLMDDAITRVTAVTGAAPARVEGPAI